MQQRQSKARRDLPSWAKTLREAREAAGLSQRELARRVGLAQETVRATEMGRPPRHSTLMAYLSVMPGLQPSSLLSGAPAPPVVTEAAWRHYELAFGFSAKAIEWIRTEVAGGFRDEVLVRGVRLTATELEGDAARAALARATCLGSGRLVSTLKPAARDGAEEITENEDRHQFAFRTTRGRSELDYRFSGTRSKDQAIELPLAYCARRLDLTWASPSEERLASMALTVRPTPIPASGAEEKLGFRMHPDAQWSVSKGRLRCRIDRPMPGFVYRISDSGEPVEARPTKWTLARTLSDARRKAGLTLREVAVVAGSCAATLLYAEDGRDPRASTLEGYLRALPGLAPQDLLPASGPGGVASADETWELMRGLYGYEVASVTKTVAIGGHGSSREVIDTRGLRPLRSDLRDFRIRTAFHRAVTRASDTVLREVESDLSETKLRRIRKEDGFVQHEFLFPKSLGRGSISYSRTYAGPRFPLNRRKSRLLDGSDDRLVSGAALPIYHPVRKVLLRVQFTGEFLPLSVQSVVLPTCVPADTPMPVLSRELSAPPTRVERGPKGTVFTLAVTRPLIGTTYAISWDVPR